jgi:hypothetical protein
MFLAPPAAANHHHSHHDVKLHFPESYLAPTSKSLQTRYLRGSVVHKSNWLKIKRATIHLFRKNKPGHPPEKTRDTHLKKVKKKTRNNSTAF